MQNYRTSLLILSLFVLFLAGIFFWAIFVPKEEASSRITRILKEQEQRADLTFKDVTFAENVGGIKYWELKAEKATMNKSVGLATLQNSKGTFLKEGKEVLRFVSPAALWDMKQKEIYLDKPIGYDVRLESKIKALIKEFSQKRLSVFHLPQEYSSQDRYWFKATNLSWKVANQKILCTNGILLSKGEVTGYSERLESDVALEKVTLLGNPKIVVSPLTTSSLTLEANLFEILSAQDLLQAQGRPRIFWEEAKITAGKLKYLQKEKKLELTENVKVHYQDIQASGNSAFYFPEEQKIILEGEALALQKENKLSGNKILVSLKEQKISLLGKGQVVITEEELK